MQTSKDHCEADLAASVVTMQQRLFTAENSSKSEEIQFVGGTGPTTAFADAILSEKKNLNSQ